MPIDKWPSSPVTSAAASNGTAAKSEGYLHGNNDGQTMCTADTCGDLVASVSSSQVAESEEARESKQSKTDLTGSPTETRAPGPCQQNHVSPNQEKNSHLPACSFRGVRSYYGALPTLRQQHIDDIISDLKSRNAWPTEDGADSSKMLDPSQRISDVQLAGEGRNQFYVYILSGQVCSRTSSWSLHATGRYWYLRCAVLSLLRKFSNLYVLTGQDHQACGPGA